MSTWNNGGPAVALPEKTDEAADWSTAIAVTAFGNTKVVGSAERATSLNEGLRPL